MSSWSNLRKLIRERLLPDLQKQVDLHYTVYEGGDGEEKNWRFWVTIEGEDVFSTDFWDYFKSEDVIKREEKLGRPVYYDEARELGARGVDDFLEALKSYLNLSIENARSSREPIIRALSIIDKRTGKNTFERLTIPPGEHGLVTAFYELRRKLNKR